MPVTFGRAGYGRRANSFREQSGEKGILQEEGIVTGVPGKEEVQQFFRPFVTHGEKHISIISVDILFGDMPIMCDEKFTILCRKREV